MCLCMERERQRQREKEKAGEERISAFCVYKPLHIFANILHKLIVVSVTCVCAYILCIHLQADSTPLYQASSMGNADEVKELLEGGADVNEPNDVST